MNLFAIKKSPRIQFVLLLVLVVAVLLAGCGTAVAIPPPQVIAQTDLEPTASLSTPTTQPAATLELPPEPDYCLDCHIDKQQLIDTADPVAEVASENEGEG